MSAALATYDHNAASTAAAPVQTVDTSAMSPVQMAMTLIQGGADPQSVREMLALTRELEADRAKRGFDAAIALAKAEIGPVTKTGRGHQERKYATFADYAAVIDPILSKYGLSYRFKTDQSNAIKVFCTLSHREGHSEENHLVGPADNSGSKNAIQALGSTLTYLQRYTLIQALGLAASDDDDGQKHNSTENDLVTIDQGQLRELRDLISETDANIVAFCGVFKIEALPDLLAKDFPRARSMLEQKRSKAAQ